MDDKTRAAKAVIELLERHLAQCEAYDLALPTTNFPARAAVLALKDIAKQALTEARDLRDNLEAKPAEAPLTGREREILAMLAEGLANKQIAYRLHISERTVQFHVRSLFNKTGATSRTEVVTTALKRRWIELGD